MGFGARGKLSGGLRGVGFMIDDSKFPCFHYSLYA
jgi:hypothetical protein